MTIQVHKRFIKKRTGQVVVHDHSKIISAIFRAQQSLGKGNEKLAVEIAQEVEDRLFKEFFSCNKIPEVENVQDYVEEALMKWNLFDVAKAFIVYRAERSRIRNQQNVVLDVKKTIDQYLGLEEGNRKDWRVKENANQDFDYPGLNVYISGTHLAQYGLYTLYPPEVAEAHVRGHIHIHDLSNSIVGYSFYGKNIITIKRNGKIKHTSLEKLFNNSKTPIVVDNGFEIKNLENTNVLDVNGSWTELKRVVRHKKREELVEVQTENGNSVIVTKDHPYFTVGRNDVTCPNCGHINKKIFRTNEDTRRYKCTKCSKSYLVEKQPKLPIEEVLYTKDIDHNYSISSFTELEVMEDENGYLFGLYLADGHFRRNDEKIVGIGITSENNEFKQYVIQTLPNLNLRVHKREIAYNNVEYMNDILIHFGSGSNNKLIPFNYDKKTMGDILSGLVDGDGNVRVSDNRIRVTIRLNSYSLLQQLQYWLTKIRVKSSLMNIDMRGEKEYKGQLIKTQKEMFSLNFTVTESLFNLMNKCYKFKHLEGDYSFRKEIDPKKYPISHLRDFINSEEYVYDITTGSSSFLIAGIKVHNCAGWSLQLLLEKGFGGVRGRISSRPAGHLDSAINQMITFLGTLQNEFAGAQAFSSVDTLLAPFIREKFEKSVEKILRQIFSLKVNGQGYELLDLLYAYRNREIQASDICVRLESFYPNVIFRDDLLQTFLRSFNEEYEDNVSFIRQNIQNLIYALNQTSRWGGQSPFVNLSFDWRVPSDLADQTAIIRGQPHEIIFYRDCQTEMDIFNRVFMEEMHRGDKHNRVFTFPIPTYSITKDFDWNHPNVDLLMQITARYGIPYFQNYCLVKETEIIGRDLKGRIRKTDLKSLKENWCILTPDGFKKVLKKYTIRYDNYPISITFANGETISCSENHMFPTSKGLKKAENLEKDDFILVGERAYDENTREGNYNFGRFLGLYLGDGYIEKGKTRINFPNKDKTIIDFVDRFSKESFMSTNTLNQRKDGLYNLYINSRAAASFIFDFTLGNNAKTKRLRSSIFDTSREFREGLIKGYHEADGNKSKHNRFEVSSTSHQLIKDMRSILISLGKRTTRRKRCIEAKGNDRKYLYTLTEASENTQQSRIFKEINGNVYCKIIKTGRSKSFAKELIDIQIEGEDKLFTLACGIVTHNSGSGIEPSSIRAMCCRLNLNLLELKSRPGGMWNIGDSTGSIGVVTINLNRLGYLAVDEDDFFRLLHKYMDLAKLSLEIKRKEITRNLENGMMAFATNYLPHGFQTYFSTIGLCGMHECCLNFLKKGIDTPEGLKFAEKVLNFMRKICEEYKKESGNLYNLEATPAESTSYRFARLDKKWYPSIITSGVANGHFITNSTHLPVDATTDLVKAIEHQSNLQPLYTGGTIFHTFLGEEIDPEACKKIVQQISEKTKLPYFSITPTFSICTEHRYIKGKHFTCPHCGKPTEVYSRIVGYFRPVSKWNDGKTQEFKDRVMFDLQNFDNLQDSRMIETEKAKISDNSGLNIDSISQSELIPENASNGKYIAVFVSPTCPRCGPFKTLLRQSVDTVEIRTIDTSTEEGLRLVREFGIQQLPTAIVFTEKGNTYRFSTIEEIYEYLPILQNL